MTDIDKLFRDSEHQKEIAVSDHLAKRMDEELYGSVRSFPIYKLLTGIAAAIALFLCIGILYQADQGYKLEELSFESHPIINQTTINIVHSYNFPGVVYDTGFLKG